MAAHQSRQCPEKSLVINSVSRFLIENVHTRDQRTFHWDRKPAASGHEYQFQDLPSLFHHHSLTKFMYVYITQGMNNISMQILKSSRGSVESF